VGTLDLKQEKFSYKFTKLKSQNKCAGYAFVADLNMLCEQCWFYSAFNAVCMIFELSAHFALH